eukprot:NODE_16190_length_1007_cov_7.987500.p1 GENE.NODE_16190_length_1007_cov_7.987500~~NODE_16190_length_1007_cov_7.987500.p1  ORF type:complete len:257 (+),score=54.66 NODE_16190_length_1007_cov_7.987500:79-849(+)
MRLCGKTKHPTAFCMLWDELEKPTGPDLPLSSKLMGEVTLGDLKVTKMLPPKIGVASWDVRSALPGGISLAAFFLPAGHVLPLHDHPGMTVLFKVVDGHAHVRGFDWVLPQPVEGPCIARPGLAWLVDDAARGSTDPPHMMLPAGGGVLHSITAVGGESCAFVDFITPIYTNDDRACTYFTERGPLATAQDVLAMAPAELADIAMARGHEDVRRAAESLIEESTTTGVGLYFLELAEQQRVSMISLGSGVKRNDLP